MSTAPSRRRTARRRTARRRTAGRLASLVTAAALSLLAAPAFAAQGSIDHVQSTRGSMQVLFSLPHTPNLRPDLGSVAATLDGTAVQASATLASGGAGHIRRTTVLAIDVSNSMANQGKFTQAKRAAMVFLHSVPADVQVGVVTFAGSVTVAQQPSLDRAASRMVVDGLRLSAGTHLYDGVSRAVDIAGTTGQRSILVLSDGRDTSTTPITRITSKLTATKTKADVVALAQSTQDTALLKPLSDAGAGSVISAAHPQQLSNVFSNEARILRNQLLITVRTPQTATSREGTLAVQVSAGGTTYSDSAFVTVARTATSAQAAAPAVSALPPATVPPTLSPTMMYAGLAAIGLAAVVIVLSLLGGLGKRQPSLETRIAAYTGKGAGQRAPAPPPQGAKAQALGLATKALASNRGLEARLGARLETAGMSLRPAEWLLLHAAIAVGSTAVAFLLTGGAVFLTLLALVAGVVLPRLYLGRKRNKRLKAFNAQLPATLQLMAGSLQAGLSLAQGMDTIVREGADPVAGEFRRALVETRLGVPVEDALDSISQRMDSDDFRWTVMAIRIQREVGGNLAELMLNVAATMRDREYLRRQVKSLSAEGRFSAYILLSMPPGVLLFESVSNGAYLHPLYSTPMGWVLLAGMLTLMGVGAFMMTRMIKLEV